ncbi:MAG: sigma-70 family RNA polymerase sigma factor [Pyrinomonadaceae bacterium]
MKRITERVHSIDETPENDFERLLAWLGENPGQAAEKYEQVRQSLLNYFRRHGAADPPSLADEVFVRVTRKVGEVAPTYVGDPTHYFLAVARNVLAEWRRQPAQAELPQDIPVYQVPEEHEMKELLLQSLEQCWAQLTPDEQTVLLRYYLETPSQSVSENREQLARELGLTVNALRVMTHRVRGKLRRCIERLAARKKP